MEQNILRSGLTDLNDILEQIKHYILWMERTKKEWKQNRQLPPFVVSFWAWMP